MSSHLALGAIGALAGLAALGRHRGSRVVNPGWSISKSADLARFSSWNEVLSDDPILVEGAALLDDGRSIPFTVRVSNNGLFQFRQFVPAWIHDELRAGGTESAYLKKLQGHIVDFVEWMESLSYPLKLYRGVRLREKGDLLLRGDEKKEIYNGHWSSSMGVARAFARGTHGGAMRGHVGAVLVGQALNPEPGDISYVLDDYLRFTAGQDIPNDDPSGQVHGQWEIGGVEMASVEFLEWA